MKWFHLAIGMLLFVAFCVTGRMMRLDFPDKDAISPELRILMRSRHIYILFNSLIWMVLGVYLRVNRQVWRRALQCAGSIFLLLSAGFLLAGWYTESYQLQHFSDVSREGIYLSLAGVGFHLIGALGVRGREPTATEPEST
jgi:hypothetical protein